MNRKFIFILVAMAAVFLSSCSGHLVPVIPRQERKPYKKPNRLDQPTVEHQAAREMNPQLYGSPDSDKAPEVRQCNLKSTVGGKR